MFLLAVSRDAVTRDISSHNTKCTIFSWISLSFSHNIFHLLKGNNSIICEQIILLPLLVWDLLYLWSHINRHTYFIFVIIKINAVTLRNLYMETVLTEESETDPIQGWYDFRHKQTQAVILNNGSFKHTEERERELRPATFQAETLDFWVHSSKWTQQIIISTGF